MIRPWPTPSDTLDAICDRGRLGLTSTQIWLMIHFPSPQQWFLQPWELDWALHVARGALYVTTDLTGDHDTSVANAK